jgi:phenylacetate-CoA ligase
MGAWATGFNMTLALNRNGIVKSTGPDLGKILSTMRFLGTGYRYLLLGYPPFIKHLLDEGDRDGIGWDRYAMHAMVGGEGMTEELRDHLLLRFRSVFSGYGATDIEIGMAGESPASVAIRRVARARPTLRQALFGDDPRLPMVFQYNPLIHHLQVNAEREVICTISRLEVMAPRIRYNVHDEGGILDYAQVDAVLGGFGLSLARLGHEPDAAGPRGPLPWVQPVRLPFLWIYGRRDATISVMGANIYPEDVETLIYRDARLTAAAHSFCLSVVTDTTATPRPCIALELNEGTAIDAAWHDRLAAQFQTGLEGLNLDYKAALAEFPAAMAPIVEIYQRGEGPFRLDSGRIKQRRIVR